MVDQRDGSRFSGISSVLLESESKNGNSLTGDRVEKSVNNLLGESILLVLVHLDNCVPVLGNSGEVERLRKVDQVEDIFLETRSTETNRRFQELGTDSRISTDGVGDFINVRSGSFTDSGKSVNGRNSLSEHSVRSELGEFGRPETDGEDSVLGNPVGVDGGQRGTGVFTLLSLERTNEDSIGSEQVSNGGTLSQELGVGQDLEFTSRLRVSLEDSSHRLGSSTRNSRFLNNDLGRGRNFGNSSGSQLDVVQVGSESSTETTLLSRGVNGDENQIGVGDSLVNLGREEQVSASAFSDNINQSRLVDRQVEVLVVPGVNSGLVQVNNGHLDVGASQSNDGTGGTTDVTGTDTADLLDFDRGHFEMSV